VARSTHSSRRRSLPRWLPLLPLLLGAPVCKGGSGEINTMDPNLQDLHHTDPVQPEHGTRPLRDVATAAPASRAADHAGGGSMRRNANARQNGRSGVDVAVGPWHVEWSVPLEPSAPPEAILAVGDRIVVQALGSWTLHDRLGAQLDVAARVVGDVVIDPGAGQIFYGDDNGFLAAARLSDGAVDMGVTVRSGGEGYSCTLLWRDGRQIGVHGFAQPQMSHRAVPTPDETLLEVIDLGDPVVKDDTRFVTSSRNLAAMSSHAIPFLVAVGVSSVLMAVPGHVYHADAMLKVKDDLTDDFVPVAMSLDELDRVHLVVRTKDEPALWVLDVAAGERHVSVPLAGEPTGAPPLVGWDHRAYVLLRTGVVALEPDGRPAWTVSTTGAPTGAIITRNGVLLVSVGSQVLLIEPDGRSRVALDVGEPLATAPVLVSGTELLVATPTRLLSARPGPRP
jgi:hypothetical protein